MIPPISISTIDQAQPAHDTPLALPSLPRVSSLQRVCSREMMASPQGSPALRMNHSGISTPLSISTEYLGARAHSMTTSQSPLPPGGLRWSNSSGVSSPARPLIPPAQSSPPLIPRSNRRPNITHVQPQPTTMPRAPAHAVAFATSSNIRGYVNPKKYSSVSPAKAPTTTSFAPATAALLKSSFACGADEMLQFHQSSNNTNNNDQNNMMTATEIEYAASLTMKESDIVNNRSSDELRSTISQSQTANAECNYDKNPTELYLAVQSKQWHVVVQRCAMHPSEASTWVSRKESDGKTLRWRMLPIHAAIVFEAPPKVIDALLGAFAHGAQCRDDQGKLPIHLCFRLDSTSPEVISLLVQAYPDSVNVKDDKGRTPMVLAQHSKSHRRDDWVRMLECLQVVSSQKRGHPGLSIKSSIELDTSTMPSAQPPSVTRPPRVPTATAALRNAMDASNPVTATSQQKPGMDSELMEKLHRRREKMNETNSNNDKLSLPTSRSEDDQNSEEGLEIEYTDGSNGVMVIESPLPLTNKQGENSDAKLLQRFHSQRAKGDISSGHKSPSCLSINCDDTSKEGSSPMPREASSCRRSIVDMAPPSLRAQIRDRLEKRMKSNSDNSSTNQQQQVSSFRELHTSSGSTVASHFTVSSSIFSGVQSSGQCSNTEASLGGFLHKQSNEKKVPKNISGGATSHCDESITVSSSICNSTNDGMSVGTSGSNSIGSLGQYFSLKRTDAWECTLETTTEGYEESTSPKKFTSPSSSAASKKLQGLSPSREFTPKKTNFKAPKTRSACKLSSKFNKDQQKMENSKKRSPWHCGENELELYASTSLMTASTAEMTAVPSYSYEDCSLSEVYTSRVNNGKKEGEPVDSGPALSNDDEKSHNGYDFDPLDDLSTPKLLMRLNRFRSKLFSDCPGVNEGPDKDEYSFDNDLATPNLMKKAERFFSTDNETTEDTPRSPLSGDGTVHQTHSPSNSITQSKYDQIMAKYESILDLGEQAEIPRKHADEEVMTSPHCRKNFNDETAVHSVPSIKQQVANDSLLSPLHCQKSLNDATSIHFIQSIGQQASNTSLVSLPQCQKSLNDHASTPSVPSIKRRAANSSQFSNSRRIDSEWGADPFRREVNIRESKGFRESKRSVFNTSPVSGLKLQMSKSQDSAEGFFLTIPQVGSMESDAVSTLSRTTGYTTSSISISTENSAVIESYVQSVVHGIVANEVENAGSLKRELETALKSKMKLEARVKKLMKQSDEKSIQLRKARHDKSIAKEKFSREMEIHLTRKASELQSCIEMALNQAEQSKQRALELTRRDMEKEVSLLRSQLETVQANGVPIDRSLYSALELVETNQRALRKAAETDANNALEMKQSIEQSFISAVGEFESWSDKQLRIMEARWKSLRESTT